MKKYIGIVLSIIMMFNILGVKAYAGEYPEKLYLEYDGQTYRYKSRIVSLVVDEKPVTTGDMPAVVIEGRTLVPIREVFESEAVNAQVLWKGETKEVYLTYEDKLVVLKIDSNIAYVNETEVTLDVPAKLIRDLSKDYAKAMIPLRFVSENLGFKVDWEADTYTAKLASRTFLTSGHDTNTEEEVEEEVVDESKDGGMIKVVDDESKEDENEDENKEDESKEEDVTNTEDEKAENEEIDQTDNEDEKLETLGSGKATRELPTKLHDQPFSWQRELDDGAGGIDINTGEKEDDVEKYELTEEKHDTVKITDVDFNNEGGVNRFVIKANGPISNVKTSTWAGKYIFDIENAIFDLNDDESYQVTYEDNPILYSVRSSQQEPGDDGIEVLRVVFDLKNADVDYQTYFNEDRTEITYEMAASKLTEINVGQDGRGDYIELIGNTTFDVETFRLSSPDRLVFDLKNTISMIGFNENIEVEGQYMDTVRTAQFDYETTRVVVETSGQADYAIEYEDGNTYIRLLEPTYSNIVYDNVEKPKIVLEAASEEVDANNITYEDNYRDGEYIITLPGNYEEIFGKGEININDEIIESIEIDEDEDGNTSFVIKEKGIYIFRIEEEDGNVVIKAYKPKEIYSQIVVIDPGHGGKDPGAVVDTMTENELNMKVMNYLYEMLEADDSVKVYYTRLEDEYVSLQERCDIANAVDADFFISIHNNAYYSQFNGTEVLYFEDEDRPGLNSVEIAEVLQKRMIEKLGLHNRGARPSNMLYVLRKTNMPAVLVEGGFMTSPVDMPVLAQAETQKKFAEAIYITILEIFKEYPTGREDVSLNGVTVASR